MGHDVPGEKVVINSSSTLVQTPPLSCFIHMRSFLSRRLARPRVRYRRSRETTRRRRTDTCGQTDGRAGKQHVLVLVRLIGAPRRLRGWLAGWSLVRHCSLCCCSARNIRFGADAAHSAVLFSSTTRTKPVNHSVGQYRCHFERYAWERVPIVKVLKNALWTALRTIFRPKMHQISRFCIHNLKIFFPLLRHRYQFPFGSPAFSLFLFYETTIGSVTFYSDLYICRVFRSFCV